MSVYAEQGPILRALADGAVSDAKLEETYGALVQAFIDANAEKIRSEQASGHIARGIDAEETARALVLMTERYLDEVFGREPQGDPARAARCCTASGCRRSTGARRSRPGRCSSSSLMPSGS